MVGHQDRRHLKRRRLRRRARWVVGTAIVAGAMIVAVAPAGAVAPSAATANHRIGPITDVSRACSGQNSEVEQAVDKSLRYVFLVWMGCKGIAFARSVDGGLHFGPPISVPRSFGPNGVGWDPAITVGPRGTVYVAFMQNGTLDGAPDTFPVVAASFDHGATFPQVASLVPPKKRNWGDRDFIAVAPDGAVYVTWDYGPKSSVVTYICSPGGSCSFATGDLNSVIQKSTDGGKTWGPIVPLSWGFPASGGDSAPLLVEPDGRIDVLYQGYLVTNTTTYALAPAHTYFTSSTDGGASWSAPVMVGSESPELTMSLAEWWIDGSLGIDAAGNLYATWDTQGHHTDVGWLSFSVDHGKHWSRLVQVPPDQVKAPHIMEVAGGADGIAYVGWLSDSSAKGWAQYVRAYSIATGRLGDEIRVSGDLYGNPNVWPGDTFGISTLSTHRLVMSWGSAVPTTSEIYAAAVTFSSR